MQQLMSMFAERINFKAKSIKNCCILGGGGLTAQSVMANVYACAYIERKITTRMAAKRKTAPQPLFHVINE